MDQIEHQLRELAGRQVAQVQEQAVTQQTQISGIHTAMEEQSVKVQSMFDMQMQKLEELLAKRQRLMGGMPTVGGELFVVGAANPSGLAGKESKEMRAGVWGMSKTHLTASGVPLFRKGLALAGSVFKNFAPGCRARARAGGTASGEYVGVGILSSYPSGC